MSRDFFDEIFFLFDVDAPRRDFEIHASARLTHTLKAESGQNAQDLIRLN